MIATGDTMLRLRYLVSSTADTSMLIRSVTLPLMRSTESSFQFVPHDLADAGAIERAAERSGLRVSTVLDHVDPRGRRQSDLVGALLFSAAGAI